MEDVEDQPVAKYVRYRSPVRHHRRNIHVGVFALVNGIRARGELTDEEEATCVVGHAWYNAAYVNPSDVDPVYYDLDVNPEAAAWFKTTATHLLARLPPYLELLRAHDEPFEVLYSDTPPGRVIYEDDVQIVVVPWGTEAQRASPSSVAPDGNASHVG